MSNTQTILLVAIGILQTIGTITTIGIPQTILYSVPFILLVLYGITVIPWRRSHQNVHRVAVR